MSLFEFLSTLFISTDEIEGHWASDLEDLPFSDAEKTQIADYDERSMAKTPNSDNPIGKRVI